MCRLRYRDRRSNVLRRRAGAERETSVDCFVYIERDSTTLDSLEEAEIGKRWSRLSYAPVFSRKSWGEPSDQWRLTPSGLRSNPFGSRSNFPPLTGFGFG
jgi:hypothetical protein